MDIPHGAPLSPRSNLSSPQATQKPVLQTLSTVGRIQDTRSSSSSSIPLDHSQALQDRAVSLIGRRESLNAAHSLGIELAKFSDATFEELGHSEFTYFHKPVKPQISHYTYLYQKAAELDDNKTAEGSLKHVPGLHEVFLNGLALSKAKITKNPCQDQAIQEKIGAIFNKLYDLAREAESQQCLSPKLFWMLNFSMSIALDMQKNVFLKIDDADYKDQEDRALIRTDAFLAQVLNSESLEDFVLKYSATSSISLRGYASPLTFWESIDHGHELKILKPAIIYSGGAVTSKIGQQTFLNTLIEGEINVLTVFDPELVISEKPTKKLPHWGYIASTSVMLSHDLVHFQMEHKFQSTLKKSKKINEDLLSTLQPMQGVLKRLADKIAVDPQNKHLLNKQRILEGALFYILHEGYENITLQERDPKRGFRTDVAIIAEESNKDDYNLLGTLCKFYKKGFETFLTNTYNLEKINTYKVVTRDFEQMLKRKPTEAEKTTNPNLKWVSLDDAKSKPLLPTQANWSQRARLARVGESERVTVANHNAMGIKRGYLINAYNRYWDTVLAYFLEEAPELVLKPEYLKSLQESQPS